jgi:hypothetical protein
MVLVFERRAEIIVGDKFDGRKYIRNEYLTGLDIRFVPREGRCGLAACFLAEGCRGLEDSERLRHWGEGVSEGKEERGRGRGRR